MYPHVLNKVCFAAAPAGRVPQANEMGIPEENSSFGMLFCVRTREVPL